MCKRKNRLSLTQKLFIIYIILLLIACISDIADHFLLEKKYKALQIEYTNCKNSKYDEIDLAKKIIEDFYNLKYDKKVMLKAILDSVEYCKTQKLRSNGEFFGCQQDYLKQITPEFEDIYSKTLSYCMLIENVPNSELDNCIENKIKTHSH